MLWYLDFCGTTVPMFMRNSGVLVKDAMKAAKLYNSFGMDYLESVVIEFSRGI